LVVAADVLGDAARGDEITAALGADGERGQLVAAPVCLPGGDGGDDRRVQAAGEEDAHADIAHHAPVHVVHGGDQRVADLVEHGLVPLRPGCMPRRPHLDGHCVGVAHHAARRGPQAPWRERRDARSVLAVERPQLAGEERGVTVGDPVQRLDTHRIARDKAVALGGDHREREHAAQPLHGGRAVAHHQVQRGLGVRPGRHGARREADAELGVVVDLAVVDDPAGPGSVRDRLPPAADVDDREALVPEVGAVEA